jgi:catechol 2,3-dioxygenase-like lactoylglutathione lyase family enzyme
MASVKQFQVTFDCADPERVARFWCEVLGYVVPPPPPGFAERQGTAFACVDPDGVGPRLFFQRVPEGKVVKNRVHLDVRVGTGLVGDERVDVLEAECARLIELGASRVMLSDFHVPMTVNPGVLLLPIKEAVQRLEHANLVMQMASNVDNASRWRITTVGEQTLADGSVAQKLA